MNFETLDMYVVAWAKERGILLASNPEKQALKMVSEVGELCDAIAVHDRAQIIDGMGDTVVTLIILAELLGLDLTECLESAYNVIADRKGKLVDGIFVKEEG